MNILIRRKKDDKIYFRPDTSLNRECSDIYVPEDISELYYSPIIFTIITKAGKYISPKFISRYFDSFSFGILLYEGEGIKNEDYACSSCLDKSSIISSKIFHEEDLKDKSFIIKSLDKDIYTYTSTDLKELESAICCGSICTSLRIGDIVALELERPKSLVVKNKVGNEDCDETRIETEFGGINDIDFKIIF